MHRHPLSVFAFSAALLLPVAPALRAQTEPPPAEALLQQTEKTYAAMQSYSDITSATYRNPDGAEGVRAECKVWFVRPGLFRIDGESRRQKGAPVRREVMWSDGETARSWSTASAVAMRAKIQLAGSKMFGTYAYHVPTLLEASYGGPRRLHQLSSPALNGQGTLDGVECYRVKGDWQGDPYEVWIGKNDFLVRKVVANYKGYEMDELHRSIAVNGTIPMEIFQFAPEDERAVAPPQGDAAASRKKNKGRHR